MKDKSFAEKNNNTEVKRTRVVVGLDIGTTKIACFVGRKNEHNKIEIIAMGKSESLGVMRGVVSNIERTVQSINAAVEATQNAVEGNLKIKNVHVGIAGQHIKSMQHRGIYTRRTTNGEISQVDIDAFVDDMYQMVMNPGEEIITVIPQEYIVDGEPEIKDPIGMGGVRLEANFHIISGQVTNVQNITRCVDRSGLSVKDIILEPIASAEAVLSRRRERSRSSACRYRWRHNRRRYFPRQPHSPYCSHSFRRQRHHTRHQRRLPHYAASGRNVESEVR